MYYSSRKLQKRLGLLTSSYVGPGKIRRGEDRLSSLPDHLLCHILSFLTTEQTVWTSLLSSRWRYLWKWVPILNLVTSDFTDDKTCAAFIDEFLNSHTESYLREFKLSIDGEHLGSSDVSFYTPCLERVINRKIQRFQVENELGWWSSEIPLTLSVCEALVCLKLHCVKLNGFENLSLPCLKVMYLEDVVFPSDAAAEKLISCSLVLEDLKISLSKYDVVVALRVCSMSLKSFTLKLVEPVYGRKHSVVIDTPRLEYLSLVDYQFQTFTVGSMSENVMVDIDVDFELDYDVSGRNIIYNFLNNFSGVRDVAISWRTLKFICTFQDRDLLPIFRDLTRLRATMCSNVCLYVLPIVLEKCPNLKHFTLELINDYPRGMITRLSTVLSRCLVTSLKYVEIESLITKKATELKLVKYFLKNSTTLKKLILRLDKSSGENHKPGLLKILLEYPRRSSLCQFEVLPVAPPPELPPGYIYVKPTTTRF